jgi:flagellar hook-basal body complex protein FliE
MSTPIAPITGFQLASAAQANQVPIQHAPRPQNFVDLLEQGVGVAEQKAMSADHIVQQFILDDSVPVHRVMFALEDARMSLELVLQVRNRLIEGYQQLMNMQL